MPGTIIWRPGASLAKGWEGADATFSDRVTIVDVFRGPMALALSSALMRGTFGTGNRLGWVCTGSTVASQKSGIGLLKITWEPGGPYADIAYLPLDDWRDEAVELYPKVERSPQLRGPSYPGNANDCIGLRAIGLAYRAAHMTTDKGRSDAIGIINAMATSPDPPPDGTTWSDQAKWAKQLLTWLMHGHETYYLAGIKTTYVRHFWSMPETILGGIIEAPPIGPHAGDPLISWLRLADSAEPVGVNGSAFRLTSTWLGGPGGHWDPVLYAPTSLPRKRAPGRPNSDGANWSAPA
jgi:hypothetical protein